MHLGASKHIKPLLHGESYRSLKYDPSPNMDVLKCSPSFGLHPVVGLRLAIVGRTHMAIVNYQFRDAPHDHFKVESLFEMQPLWMPCINPYKSI